MQPHPLSELLPSMDQAALQQLADDIKAHGLRQPIVTYNGQILDGRHRFKACSLAGVAPAFTAFSGDDAGAAALVFSANLARRQLTKSQLALVGARLKAWHAEQAHARKVEAGQRGNKTRHGHLPDPVLLPGPAKGEARDQAASAVGVGSSYIDRAEKVMKKAVPEVTTLVERGEMSLNQASQLAELPAATQRRIAQQPTKAARHAQLATSVKRSAGGKKAGGRASLIVQAADAPGTPLVRTLLSRLELLTNEIERSGLTAQQFAERFVADFDWSEPLLVRRLSYVQTAVEMVSTLSVMSQRARKSAA